MCVSVMGRQTKEKERTFARGVLCVDTEKENECQTENREWKKRGERGMI